MPAPQKHAGWLACTNLALTAREEQRGATGRHPQWHMPNSELDLPYGVTQRLKPANCANSSPVRVPLPNPLKNRGGSLPCAIDGSDSKLGPSCATTRAAERELVCPPSASTTAEPPASKESAGQAQSTKSAVFSYSSACTGATTALQSKS